MPRKSTRLPNIVYFGVDSLRSDHMSAYDYHRLTTPHIDRLADEGVLFEKMFSPNIPTPPGYIPMLTGRDLFSTQVVSLHHKDPLDPAIPTLPEILRDFGYSSACIGFGPGLYRGFDEYAEYRAWMNWEERPGDKAGKLNEVTMPILNRMAASNKPFFLFMRHMDPHSPYLPPHPYDRMFYTGDECDPNNKSMEPVFAFAPFADFFRSWMPPGITDIEYVNASYDGALAYMDGCIQQLLNRLDELGIVDETIVVFTADHGETLDEHDCYFDHHGLYEPTLTVPLIIRYPGRLPEGVRVPGHTQLKDIVPTLMELIGIRPKVKFDGMSQIPLLTGDRATNATEFYITECTWMRKHGIRTTEWKFFEALEPDFHNKPPVELYNLVEDPLELNNLADKEPGMVKELRRRMNAWIKKRTKQTGKGNPILDYHIGTDRRIGSVATANKLQKK